MRLILQDLERYDACKFQTQSLQKRLVYYEEAVSVAQEIIQEQANAKDSLLVVIDNYNTITYEQINQYNLLQEDYDALSKKFNLLLGGAAALLVITIVSILL